MTVITANMARRICIQSKLGFMELVNHAIHTAAEAKQDCCTLTIPRNLYDLQQEIRDELEAAGYEVLVETHQGCCMPDERRLYLNWGLQA